MSLSPGVRLGPYKIVSPIGSGGMGEVYRALDTRLGRSVAIKVLAPELAANPDLRSRFDREARAISALNHPHVCALYDVGRAGDVEFLVLELLDGQTLADRLASGPLPPAEALHVAIQICDALDKAHRAGIVHRDLKPANVMLTRSGAKLLDFGLAKPAAPVVTIDGRSMLPTTPPGITAHGAILGTFQYMAPEQIEGLEADARTDIFAFGAVLFEMIAGRPAFDAKTRAGLLGAILKDVPPRLSTVTPLVPPSLDRVTATCLEKEPDDRYQSARDLLRDLKWAATEPPGSPPTTAVPSQAAPKRLRTVAASLALIVGGVLAGAYAVQTARPVTGTEPIQFIVAAPEKHGFGGPQTGGTGQATQIAISPDGRQLAFVASEGDLFQLWVRPAATAIPRLLAGTEGASFPFWSPDGRYLGFFAGGKLKKIPVAGGPPLVLSDSPSARGGTWNRDNVIVFGSGGVLSRVSASGGTPVAASRLDASYGETSHRWPSFLPDGRHFVFTATVGVCCPPSKPAEIRIGSLDSLDTIRVFHVDSAAQYASGHLLYVLSGTLMAQPFDSANLRFVGDAFPVAEKVSVESVRYASFSTSANGVLAFAHGGADAAARLTWRRRTGEMMETVGDPGIYYLHFALSSDERRIAVARISGGDQDRDIWIIDTVRGTTSRLTSEPGPDIFPVWSPDATRIAFQGVRNGSVSLRQKVVSATSADEPLSVTAGIAVPTDWSSDGRYVIFNRVVGGPTTSDVWALPLFGDKQPFAVVATPFIENNGALSPDLKWIAYQSNETGTFEVYVQPFPPSGGRYQVSRGGGAQPTWRADGTELYFLAPPDARLMAVSVDARGKALEMGIPQDLFKSGAAPGSGRQYAPSRDGQRFLINTQPQQGSSDAITVTVNWLAAVQR